MSGMILFIVGAASTFSWVLTVAGLPQFLVDALASIHHSQSLFLFGSCFLLVVIGAVLEGLPALLITGPLLVPLAEQIGVNPLHYGIVLIIAIGTGSFLPPIGVGFYIACAVCNAPVGTAGRYMIPFIGILMLGLLIVAFVPSLTLIVPIITGFGR
jgi:TRAP-type C4-dicarboxylate transport system permease large subunit